MGSPTRAVDGSTRMGSVFDEFFKCVRFAYGNNDRITELAKLLKEHKERLIESMPQVETRSRKNGIIRSFNIILEHRDSPSATAKNKGSGKRLKSLKEIASEQAAKDARKCWTCNKYRYHDSRNCELRPKTKKQSATRRGKPNEPMR
ncbi:PREDICTED: uncharacterized protein LOC109167886 [Ipomoea nil]|uniref:uncharacterized protein LOC109167886 n=1 Tax=Ipomoea nil TaxID=35883 RepID=UPI000902017D|nr:PREDICTED: uncharacterized protein LOC109167886 [Ipomoea nil]